MLQIITCTVYTVKPYDHYSNYPNTTCHHCHSLQHYLFNVTKYFTSNTQLLFLPGLHYLYNDFIIQNVHNISLIGSTGDGTTLDTVIECVYIKYTTCITITNVSTLIIRNLIIKITAQRANIIIKDCLLISLKYLQFKNDPSYSSLFNTDHFTLVGINIMSNSYFTHITLPAHGMIKLLYNEKNNTDKQYHILTLDNCKVKTISINIIQQSYIITLKIINIRFDHINNDNIISSGNLGKNKVFIINCQFISNTYDLNLLSFDSSNNGSIKFINCQFENNTENLFTSILKLNPSLIQVHSFVNLEFKNCVFNGYSIETGTILQTYNSDRTTAITHVLIKNTSFTFYTFGKSAYDINPQIPYIRSFIMLSQTNLQIEDLVVFSNITTPYSIISLRYNSSITITGLVEFLYNYVNELINFYENNIKYIIIKENSVINIFHNEAKILFATKLTMERYPYPLCFFQYFTTDSIETVEKRNFLIRFYNNQCKLEPCFDYIPITNCRWLLQTAFNTTIPLEINNYYIKFINDSGAYKLSQIIEQSSLCICTDELHYDCHINDFGYLYPGQTVTVFLHHKSVNIINSDTAIAVGVKTDINLQYITPCTVLNVSENVQLTDDKGCKKLHYTIGFPSKSYCELSLKIVSDSDFYLNVFYIWQITCPTGFIKINDRCQCDPVLVQYGITNCNINDQSILRPANSWISATTHNNSYTYHISLHCSFHYCLPHSSHLNFSTPNSQCQFSRSGILCGHCQQGLSTVFSSHHCQHCSSIYLLLIIPIAIAGVGLVLLLFVLNLTVTDGTINGFIFYVNIISINTPVLFTELNHFTPTYTFISLANLDLGIQTCFYNGMNDYAKMWLQLAFPFYLIFIATLIIITSHYSTTIQRLTARRALPVLATLFLLSYTKILRIVSSVLFFYSTITHLPSKHTTLAWSVDANVPLFGVRFTVLFVVCLILFLILVPFNVILLFTRTLSRFRIINRFKPLLDAYQGPYKDKYYYWTGLQLLIRAVFFGISSLDRSINLTVSILLFSVIIGIHGMLCPFKVKHKNYQELLLFLNLHGIYAIFSHSPINDNEIIVNIAITVAAVQFIFIIIYHMITYVCDGVFRNKIQLSINTFTGWIARLHHTPQHQKFQLESEIRDNIPEVAFNYHEYREPLVGIDC